jgi:hypothetical protein
MNKNITQNDLIRFIYQETTKEENFQILQDLDENFELREELNSLMKTLNMLNELSFNPSDSTLKILNEEASSSSFEMS